MSTHEILPNSNLEENTPSTPNTPVTLTPKYSMDDIFQNSIRSWMWGLFSMYPELTLADLSKYLNKSKSTIHPHLKMLEEMEIIEEIREEQVRGRIKSKIYSLKKGYDEKFASWGLLPNCTKTSIDEEMGIGIAKNSSNWIQIQIDNLKLQQVFFQELEKKLQTPEKKEALEILERIYGLKKEKEVSRIMTKKTLKSFGYFDEKTYLKLRELFSEFYTKLAKFSHDAEKDNPTIEKPYYFFMNVIPMKEVYDFLFQDTNKGTKKNS